MTIRLLLMVLIGSFLLSSCYDYEYGPRVSLRTKKGRLTNEWELRNVVKNNFDTISNYPEYNILFEKDYTFETEKIYSTGSTDSIVTETGDWSFDEKAENIILIYIDSLDQKEAGLFEILKLTNDELWVSQVDSANEFWYFFETAD